LNPQADALHRARSAFGEEPADADVPSDSDAAESADRISEYERLLAENARYTESFDRSALTAAPLSGLAVLACMDARLDVEEALGLHTGDAHIIRNAGGLVTDDVIRSLIVSMELLGTDEIVVIEHTKCGLQGVDDAGIRERVAAASGLAADQIAVRFGGFSDLAENVVRQVEILRTHPYLRRVPIHGLIFDVSTGRLHEVA
jgi:carbonic anhydrase